MENILITKDIIKKIVNRRDKKYQHIGVIDNLQELEKRNLLMWSERVYDGKTFTAIANDYDLSVQRTRHIIYNMAHVVKHYIGEECV